MIWMNESREQIKADNPGIKVTEIAKKAGEMWRELTDKSVHMENLVNIFLYLLIFFFQTIGMGRKSKER